MRKVSFMNHDAFDLILICTKEFFVPLIEHNTGNKVYSNNIKFALCSIIIINK